MTWIGAAQPSPAVVIHNNLPSPCMQFGPFYPRPESSSDSPAASANGTTTVEMQRAGELGALFDRVDGVKAEIVEDMQTERWKKVIWSVTSLAHPIWDGVRLTRGLATTQERGLEPDDGPRAAQHGRLHGRDTLFDRPVPQPQSVPFPLSPPPSLPFSIPWPTGCVR